MRDEKERFDRTRHFEKELGRKLKYEPSHEASSLSKPGKPVLYLDVFPKNNVYGEHDLIDVSEDTRLTRLFGTNEEVKREANKMYGKHYEIITTCMAEPMSEFGEFVKVIDRYRKKKSAKPKPKRKVTKKCKCK